MDQVRYALVLAICAVALGPWVSALWATNGFTPRGSSMWLRQFVHLLFWWCLLGALGLTAWEGLER